MVMYYWFVVWLQRYLALDDRVAWAYYQFPSDMFNGETVKDWVVLSGKQGEGQEGIILSFTVSGDYCVYICLCML